MSHSIVVCADCGEANTAVEWGFVLLAREGWTAQLSDNGRDPEWRCPACNAKLSDLERRITIRLGGMIVAGFPLMAAGFTIVTATLKSL